MINNSVIYRVKEVSFKIDGVEYDVSSIGFLASTNGIPQCVVSIAPNDGDGSIVINSLDIVSLKEAYDDLSDKAMRLAKATLHAALSIKFADGKSSWDDQTLDLENWVLATVGLSRLSTTSAFSLTCMICHPAYRLTTRSGLFFNASGTLNIDAECDKATNPVSAAYTAIDIVMKANANKIKTLCSPIDIYTRMKTPDDIDKALMAETASLLEFFTEGGEKQLVKWDKEFSGAANDLPMEKVLSTKRYRHGVKYALVNSWISSSYDSSMFDVITQSVNPMFALELAATWDKPYLSLVPKMPWKDMAYELNDFMVQEVTYPGKDPDPLYGCILYQGDGSAPPGSSVTFARAVEEGTAIQPSNMAFVPYNASDSIGKLMHLGPGPAWVDLAREKAAAIAPVNVTADGRVTFERKSDDDDNGNRGSAGENKDLQTWNKVTMLYLAQKFMDNYRRSVDANTYCAFMTKIGGKTIVPGKVAGFKTGDKILFTGEISSVEHFIDCARSVAYTKINMSYCQSPGANANVLGERPICPYYDAAGDEQQAVSSDSEG